MWAAESVTLPPVGTSTSKPPPNPSDWRAFGFREAQRRGADGVAIADAEAASKAVKIVHSEVMKMMQHEQRLRALKQQRQRESPGKMVTFIGAPPMAPVPFLTTDELTVALRLSNGLELSMQIEVLADEQTPDEQTPHVQSMTRTHQERRGWDDRTYHTPFPTGFEPREPATEARPIPGPVFTGISSESASGHGGSRRHLSKTASAPVLQMKTAHAHAVRKLQAHLHTQISRLSPGELAAIDAHNTSRPFFLLASSAS